MRVYCYLAQGACQNLVRGVKVGLLSRCLTAREPISNDLGGYCRGLKLAVLGTDSPYVKGRDEQSI